MDKKEQDQLFEKFCYEEVQRNRHKLNGGGDRTVCNKRYEIIFSNVENSAVESKQLLVQKRLNVAAPLCVEICLEGAVVEDHTETDGCEFKETPASMLVSFPQM